MQAEDRHLPHQPVDGAGGVNGLVRAQTVAHEPQIFPERRAVAVDVGDVRVGAGERGDDWQSGPDRNQRVFFGQSQRRSQIAVAAKRVFDPRVYVGEFLTVRLFGVARGDLGGDGGQSLRVILQRSAQGAGRRGEARRFAQSAAQGGHGVAVLSQDQALLQPQRLPGDFGSHERVAVAVAADPRAEPERRRPVAQFGAGKILFQLALQLVEQRRRGVEQRRVEVIKPVIDLVEHRRLRVTHLVGLPYRFDLGREPRLQFVAEARGQIFVVEVGEEVGDSAMFFEQGSARGFGRVRGHYRHDVQTIDHPLQQVRVGEVSPQPPQSLGQRPALRLIGRAQFVKALATDAVILLRDVDQLKVDREGPDHAYRLVQTQSSKQTFKLTLGPGRLPGALGSAKSFAESADVLFNLKKALSSETLERFAQQIAQPTNVRPQRRVFRLIGA